MQYASKHINKANCQQIRACSLAPAARSHEQCGLLEPPVRDAICLGYAAVGAGSRGRGDGHGARQQGLGGHAARGRSGAGQGKGGKAASEGAGTGVAGRREARAG